MTRSLALPIVFADGDLATADGAALARAKTLHVLLTEPGEMPWRTAFGTPLDALRHRPMDAVQGELVRLRCRDALAAWMPSLVARVTAGSGEASSLVLRIHLGDGAVVEVAR